jgi:uncharacterized membrane protein
LQGKKPKTKLSVKSYSSAMTTQHIILIITATATALIAGLFYAYTCSVNIGLGKLSDEGYIAAMQSINREIQNPLFFISFMGTLLLLPISTWLQYKVGVSNTFYLLLAASLVYAVATFGVTVFGNVPLNDALDQFNLKGASAEEIHLARQKFEGLWNSLHNIRTVASVVSLVLVIVACIKTE